MATLKFLKGNSSNISTDITPFSEGSFLLTVDNGLLYTDYISNEEKKRTLVNQSKFDEINTILENDYATKIYVDTEVAELVNSAPETLDTLGELAVAFEENKEVVDVLNEAIVTKASVDYVETSGKKIIETTKTTYTLEPNRFYIFGIVSSLNISLGTEVDGITNEFAFEFTTATSISSSNFVFPSSIKWVVSPTIEANKTYQVSILRNVGVIVGV